MGYIYIYISHDSHLYLRTIEICLITPTNWHPCYLSEEMYNSF